LSRLGMVVLGIVASRNGRSRNGRVRNGRSRIGTCTGETSPDYFYALAAVAQC
jgi:hypothetical protein